MRKRITAVIVIVIVVAGAWVLFRDGPSRVLPRDHGPELRFILTGHSANDEFGGVVEILADGNGDGRPDLAVGAPYDDAGGEDAGRVFIHDHEGRPLWQLVDGRPGGCFGSAVRRIGDIDGDGVDDIAVGASGQGANLPGRVVAYSGATRRLLWKVDDDEPRGRFGHCIEGLGDVDGDGIPDVAIGAPGSHRRDVAGRVSIRSGRDGARIREIAEDGERRFGFALARHGNDLAVASRWAKLRVISLAGGEETDGTLDLDEEIHDLSASGAILLAGHFRQDRPGAAFVIERGERQRIGRDAPVSWGHTVSCVGDVDGDGSVDFAVAAPDAAVGGLPRVGIVDVLGGEGKGRLMRYRGEREDDNLGYALCGGDLDGDGYAEVVMGTTVDDGTPGHVRVISFRRRIDDGTGKLTTFEAPVDMGPRE